MPIQQTTQEPAVYQRQSLKAQRAPSPLLLWKWGFEQTVNIIPGIQPFPYLLHAKEECGRAPGGRQGSGAVGWRRQPGPERVGGQPKVTQQVWCPGAAARPTPGHPRPIPSRPSLAACVARLVPTGYPALTWCQSPPGPVPGLGFNGAGMQCPDWGVGGTNGPA